MQSAGREPILGKDALSLLDGVSELLVARGRKTLRFDLAAGERPDEETLLSLLLGRAGKLRAPAMRVGSRLLVGFGEEMYESVFG